MRKIRLTQGKFALVDDSDYELLSQWKWYVNKIGRNFYAQRGFGGRKDHIKIRMHRFILGVTDTKLLVDHRNGDTLDNRRSNLRIATRSQNNSNRISRPGSTSKYLGVYWSKVCNSWHVRVRKNGITKHIGYFKNENDAAIAYNTNAVKIHGEFSRLNVVLQ